MDVTEIDWRSPADAFAPLVGVAGAHLLHGGDRAQSADWSIIVAFPAGVVETGESASDNPFRRLDAALRDRGGGSLKAGPAPFPFISGALGFAGYESARFVEPSLCLPPSPHGLPDCWFGIYDASALFSRSQRRCWIAGRDAAARRRLERALGADPLPPPQALAGGAPGSNFNGEQYERAVSEIIGAILDGDYYQANLSQAITVPLASDADAFTLFRLLASRSDAFHGAFLQFEGGAVVSNSPERFFRVEESAGGARRIVAEPIKGTRPRGDTPREDRALAAELLADPKDRAENVMIADLLRNDLSRICRDGTICEEAVCALMSLTHVHHLVSRISGVLRDDVRLGDIFTALFPCGSITGAPKIEAMRAIARLEKIGRGPYCGAIGYADDRGGADFSVAIRTLIVSGGVCTLPSGGGVTLRSDPAREYRETLVKAGAALAALGRSAEDLA